MASDLGQPVPYETMQPLQVALEDIDDNEPLFVRPPVSDLSCVSTTWWELTYLGMVNTSTALFRAQLCWELRIITHSRAALVKSEKQRDLGDDTELPKPRFDCSSLSFSLWHHSTGWMTLVMPSHPWV